MIKHIVFWEILPKEGKDQKQEVLKKFHEKTEHLKKVIPEIIDARVALNKSESGFDICIDSIFESMETLETYIQHPEHLKVRAYMDSVTGSKTVFDYEFDGDII